VSLISKKIVIFILTLFVLTIITKSVLMMDNCYAAGNTIYVDDGGGADYTDIQDAIDAASDGDTIYVYSGTYDSIEIQGSNIGKITLIGEDKDSTIIDGDDNGHVVRAYDTLISGNKIEIHISDFTIKNAGGNGFDCISLSYAENCTISNNKIINGDVGEGIQLDHCNDITIKDNSISNCQGSGIGLSISIDNTIDNNLIQSNQKGIQLSSSSNNNIITNNTIKSHTQYGIYLIQSTNNKIYFNDLTDNDQNALDYLSNYWSYNSKGNYWDDYNGYDNNSDDIGDIPYNIPGDANQDNYPLGYFKEPESPGGGNQQPTAHLPSISPNPVYYEETVLFSGSGSDSDGFIEGFNWRSSIDGQLSSQSSFSMSSLSIGTHTIYFKVQDNDGAWSSEKSQTLTINFLEDQEPTAVIDSIIPNPASTDEIISFKGHGNDEGIITDWKWISSIDGVISSNKTFKTDKLSDGVHTIYFQVMDNSNKWSKQDTEVMTVYKGSTIPYSTLPVADAGGPYFGGTNKKIIFNASNSYDDGSIIDYNWDFGDGYYGNGKIQSHYYESSGNYSVILTITDNDGNVSTDVTYISINDIVEQESPSKSLPELPFTIPFPVLVIIEIVCVISIIGGFFFWIKRKYC
jgi:parallel beta-helix repeat protein